MEHIMNDIVELASISTNDTYLIEYVVPYILECEDDTTAILRLKTKTVLLSKTYFTMGAHGPAVDRFGEIFDSIINKEPTNLIYLDPDFLLCRDGGELHHCFSNNVNDVGAVKTIILSVTPH
ncbi:MAG: hypothetical protein ACI9YE_000466 [Psychroserpens sp.]|jgi:hypothetical protein